MSGVSRHAGLDTLLDLDGQVFVVDPTSNHWVKFSIKRVKPSHERHMGSATHSHYTQMMESDWSGSIMPTMFAPPTGPETDCGNNMTTNTDFVTFVPMHTKMPLHYFRISGSKSMPYLKSGV